MTAGARRPRRARRPLAVLALLALLLGLAGPAAAAPLVGLDGQWQPVPASGEAAEPPRDFDPQRPALLPRSAHGHRIALHPRGGHWPAGPWVLEVRGQGLQRITLEQPGQAPQARAQTFMAPGQWPGHGRLGFHVDAAPADGQPLLLRVEIGDAMPSALQWSVLAEADYLRRDASWLAAATASFAVMLAMAVMALFFSIRLRSSAFAFYTAYVLAYALVMALQTGYTVHPLGLDWLGASTRMWGRTAVGVAIISAILFLDRFAELPQRLPRARRWLMVYALLVAAVTLMPLLGLDRLAQSVVNPMLALGAPVLLGSALVAAWRGSRMATLFLVGWTPLLAVTAFTSLGLDQRLGMAWEGDLAALAAGAFEALVLALGLAERSAAVRHERDQALEQAGTDSLTGLPNRRGWDRTLEPLLAEATPARPLALLFIDLDHFKRINDSLGHAVGDRCLQQLARILRQELDGRHPVARYGGEEFVAALAGTDGQEALALAERIRLRVRGELAGYGPTPVTVSIGVALLRPGEDASSLLHRADLALYRAKQEGRDRVRLAAQD